eukprot:1530344-Lingulodinium_polyedra.AAC.1
MPRRHRRRPPPPPDPQVPFPHSRRVPRGRFDKHRPSIRRPFARGVLSAAEPAAGLLGFRRAPPEDIV